MMMVLFMYTIGVFIVMDRKRIVCGMSWNTRWYHMLIQQSTPIERSYFESENPSTFHARRFVAREHREITSTRSMC